ncbi:MAG TPA: glycosyltransferase family 39 protein [Candidatus Sulfotelmatobacter sp.]|nr:glycosyltransferase family 39 protein [Candidatus Sulfotelmatobacter sp.]
MSLVKRAWSTGWWPIPVVVVALIALVFRLYHLGAKSLWLDEIIQASAAGYQSLHEVIAWTRGDDQMPLLNVVTWSMRGLTLSEAVLRMPSAIAGVLTVPVLYLLGRDLFGRRTGWLASLLACILPFALAYSQEARPYAFLMFGTTLQMYFAYQVVTRRGILDSLGLATASLFNLYSHYMALAPTLAAAFFVGGVLAVDAANALRRSAPERDSAVRAWIRGARPALLAAAIILVGYLPWARTLRDFLRRGSQGFGRYAGQGHHVTLADLQALLGALSFSGVTLVLLVIGAIACAVWLWHGRARPAALLGAWLLVPIAALSFRLHAAVLLLIPRYFSFLVPAGILLVALGIDGLARLAARAYPPGRMPAWLSRARAAGVVTLALSVALAGQILPATVAAYQAPKDDYRDAAGLLMASSPPDSVVLTVGQFYNFAAIGLKYYLGLHHSPIAVIDGSQLDDRSVARLEQGHGAVWEALFTSYANNDLDRAATDGLEVHRFPGIALVRLASSSESPAAQATTLLSWSEGFEPQVQASLDFMTRLGTGGVHGPSLLTAMPEPIEVHASGPEVDVAAPAVPASSGERVAVLFACRTRTLSGEARVEVAANDAGGAVFQFFITADRYPLPNGYLCAPAADWSTGAFAFTVPQGAASLTVRLTATGTGTAEFRDVQVIRIG